ncbi:ABC transporter substrate-binding protein [Marinomonas sp. C2222]|uniref:ABC transporter substrate-binding protein n=1 Tax=Marinomonas sargassi TaxID=2984494 RepID=A0ABT2YT34_9GAMM|nr:ABC transporter substrate-binding protein [Marinomonas sargassi]MCV2403054.1 ABC transporter substrate-binding protein [Marinomonas sargassi]
MKFCLKVALLFSLIWSGSLFADESARQAVINLVDAFRTDIVADKDILANDPVLLESRVDGVFSQVIDFDVFAKKIMGKYYRRANAEQRTRFSTVTKDTLLKTYGNALLDLDPNKINVLPLGAQKNSREVKVDVTFELDQGGKLDISFLMVKSKNQIWQLSNVVINNINFGLTFRKQFGVMMSQNKNNIDDAISAWQQSLAKKPS